LHALPLGVFKHARDTFFEHVGKNSKLARKIDALAMLCGELHCRQSDREMPNKRFPSGIRAGKQNGKKHTGDLLCLLTAICSGKGQKVLETRPKWRETSVIKDWILLLETLLEWEAWLNSDKMIKSDIQKAKTKHRHIMHLMRKVAVRQTGMGLKLMKFHGILHVADVTIDLITMMTVQTPSCATKLAICHSRRSLALHREERPNRPTFNAIRSH